MAQLKGVVRMDSLPIARTYFTEEGYLVDRPILTSTGIFEYRNEDGSIRRELRLPEEVFDPDSLKSYRLKPIIITHDAGLVTKDNVQDYQVGTIVSDGYKSGDDVRAEIVIHDTNAMKRAGLKELSLGYNLDLDETPGVWEGEPYDAIQRNIRINHLALVREARAGDQARLNIDSRDRLTLKGGKATMRVKTRKTTHNDSVLSPEELSKAIEEYKARRAGEAMDAEPAPAAPVAAPAPAPVVVPAPAPAPAAQLAEIKDRNSDADEDMKLLFDIIDTLLADRAFDSAMAEQEAAPAEEPAAEETQEDELPPEFLENMQKAKAGKKPVPKAAAKKDGKGCKADCGPTLDADDEEEEDPGLLTDADEEDPDEDDAPIIETDADDEDPDEEEPAEEEEADITTDADDDPDDDPDDVDDDPDDDEDAEMATDDATSISYANAQATPAANRKPDIINADSADLIDSYVRERVLISRMADKLNLDGLDRMPLKDAKKAIIRTVTPNIRLDGKSNVYIDALYDRSVDEINARTRKDTRYQAKQMFNRDSRQPARRAAQPGSAEAARQAMIARRQNKKED